MSISTYSELKDAIANWLGRTNLTSRIPEFIVGCEARIAYGSGPPFPSEALRIRAMETSSDLTINARTVALPTRYLQTRRIYIDTNPVVHLKLVSPEHLWETYPYSGTVVDKPKVVSVEGDNYVFGPSPDATYTGKCLFYQKFASFSADSDTNWLLTNHPMVYVYGSLLEAYPYIRGDERIPTWHGMYTAAISGLMRADKLDRFSGSSLVSRVDNGNP